MEKLTNGSLHVYTSVAAVQAELQSVTYQGAIQHYKNQKLKFYLQYKNAADLTWKEAVDTFEQEVIDEINANPVENQEKLINDMYKDLVNAVIEKAGGSVKENSDSRRKQLRELYGSFKKIGEEALKYEAFNLITEEEMYQRVLFSLQDYGIEGIGYSSNEIITRFKNYKNKIIKEQIKKNKISGSYKIRQQSKGYLREAMIHKVFYELFNRINNVKPVQHGNSYTIHAGAIRTASKSGFNVESPIDEYINFLGNIEQDYIVDATDNLNLGFGVQSKSWITPWEGKAGKDDYNFYSIGRRASLLDKLPEQNKYRWIEAVKFLGQTENTLLAIGKQNIMFITGKKFYWTHDLIAQFRNNQYYLAFVYNRDHKATPSVQWEHIDLDK